MNWKRASIAVVLLVPVIGLLAFGLTRDPKAIDSPLPGKVAPEFSLAVFAPGEGQLARGIGDTVRIGPGDHRPTGGTVQRISVRHLLKFSGI